MREEYWLRQVTDEPLFPDLLWSRPENKAQAGKLLVVGGNLHGFSAAAAAFAEATKAGAGNCRVLLPDSLKRTVGKLFPEAEFAPSTPVSGGLGQKAMAELLDLSGWADGVLIAGDIGKNSQTALLFSSYLQKFKGQVTLVNDAVDECLEGAECLDRPNTTLLVNFSQLQKLGVAAKVNMAFTSSMDLLQLVQALHQFSQEHAANLLVSHAGQLIVAAKGQVSTTKAENEEAKLTKPATHASVWWLQNPDKPFEALTTSLFRD